MSNYLEARGIRKHYGKYLALDGVSFDADKGEIIALLGPSGCGKTTLLNLIAGFLAPDEGSISVNGKNLANTPPHKRGMGMVFQGYALFPHMTIAENVSFGLEMRGVDRSSIQRRVAEALDSVQLPKIQDRYPKELSGGQQQRVALARALVVRPDVLLLDEPLSNLDAILRKTMREDMRTILKEAGITAILVTHDHEEALVTADRIILMSRGRVEQVATPSELYERPETVFSAHFMDFTNLVKGKVVGSNVGTVTVETALGKLVSNHCKPAVGESVTVVIRPENIMLNDSSGDNQVTGELIRSSYHGAVRRLEVSVGGAPLVAHVPARLDSIKLGDNLNLSWRAEDTLVLPEDHEVEQEANVFLNAGAVS